MQSLIFYTDYMQGIVYGNKKQTFVQEGYIKTEYSFSIRTHRPGKQ